MDAGNYFYLKSSRNFNSMPACWKNFYEPQHREVATLLGSFYDESRGDRNKEPWLISNLKTYLNLGYVKLDDLHKVHSDYLATLVN